ncbi:MAG: Cas10/Cmr2 second palm domain-containing protein [Anaerolineae bacterium]
MAAYPDRVESNKALCSVCDRRDGIGREKRKRIHGQDIRGRFNQEFWQACGAHYTAVQPEDLDTLLKSARRKYLAFLYADGNEIGRLLQRARSEQEYQALSRALAKGTKKAVFEAIAKVCGNALKSEEVWPFDIVNVGGDDVTLLFQAGYAWEVAVEFLECFEQEVNQRVRERLASPWQEGGPERITASCGIAIADVKYPMRYFERLASDLLKEAKKLAKRDPANPQSAVTFLWLPTPVASEKAEPLMAFYSRHPIGDLPCELTARPYTLEQAREILKAGQGMARWPRTLRHRWAEALGGGVMTSVNLIHYDIARRPENKRQEIYPSLVQIGKLAAPNGDHIRIPAPIWYQIQKGRETVWRTALLDALELAELAAMRPEVEEEAE